MSFRYSSVLLLAPLFVGCGQDKAVDSRISETAMVVLGLVQSEVDAVLAEAASSTSSTSRCVPVSSGGCSQWCNDDKTEKAHSCDLVVENQYTCGSKSYSMNKVKSYFNANVSKLTSSDSGVSGTLTMEFDVSGQYTGPKDVSSLPLNCKLNFTAQVSAGSMSSVTLSCLKYDCSMGGAEVPCNKLQLAMKLHTCEEDSGDGGDSDGGGTVTSPGSCQIDGTTRCQDFTGSVWTAALAEQACTAPNAYFSTACATENRVGSCAVNPGTAQETTTRFYSPETATDAESICLAASGTFTAD